MNQSIFNLDLSLTVHAFIPQNNKAYGHSLRNDQFSVPTTMPLSELDDQQGADSYQYLKHTMLVVGLCQPSVDIPLMSPVHLLQHILILDLCLVFHVPPALTRLDWIRE